MKRYLAWVVYLLSAVLIGTAAAGSDPDHRDNAAMWYRRAIERMDRLDRKEWELIWHFQEDRSQEPSPELRAVLAKVQPIIDLFRRGSTRPWSDFGVADYEALTRPGAQQALQQVASLTQVDAIVRLQDGHTADAAQRIAAVYRAAAQPWADEQATGPFIRFRLFSWVDVAEQHGFDRASFTVHDSELILKALRRLDGPDPFNCVAGIAGRQEKMLSVLWPGGDEQVRQSLPEWLFNEPGQRDQLLAMTEDEFAAQAEQCDVLMDHIASAFAMDDREATRAELEKVTAEIAAGKFGLLAQSITMSPLDLFDMNLRLEKRVQDRLAMLRKITKGELDPAGEANAATYYWRAIEMLGEIPLEQLEAACSVIVEDDEPIAEEVLPVFEKAEAAVDVLREGSRKQRCDFSVLRGGPPWRQFCPKYDPGLWVVLRLLRADAARLLQSEKREEAADRLAVSYRIIAHLSGDDRMMSALVAHHAFIASHDFALTALENESLNETDRTALLSIVRRIDRADPFGYLRAIQTTRKNLAMRCEHPRIEEPEFQAELATRMRRLDGDCLLYALAVHDTIGPKGVIKPAPADGEERPLQSIERLKDILSFDALTVVRGEAPAIEPVLARGEVEVLLRDDLPCIGQVVKRQRAARGDLRRAVKALQDLAAAGTGPIGEFSYLPRSGRGVAAVGAVNTPKSAKKNLALPERGPVH
jgi:hypothetical protein